MALRVSGLDLVVKNFTGFMNNTRQAAGAMTNFGNTSDKAQQQINRLATGMSNAVRKTENAALRLKNSGEQVGIALKNQAKALSDYEKALTSTDEDAKAEKLRKLEIETARLTQAINNQVIASNNLVIAQKAEQASADRLWDAKQKLSDGYQGFSNLLVQQIPILGKLVTTGGMAVEALGGLGAVLPVVGAAFIAAGATVWAFNKALGAIGYIVNLAINALKGLANMVISAFKGVGSIIEWATRPLRTFLQHVVEIASGIALWRFIRNTGEAFKNLTTEVAGAVAEFQGLEIRLDGLMARDYAKGLGIPMAEAFQQSAGAGQELFKWMRQLAVTTPFQMVDIANMFTLSSAMGLSADKTKELTVATTNFSAAMNLTDEALWRIIYNFGQMIQRGKLSGEEFRDLARNMVPIDDIMTRMAASAGMSKEAFRKMALEGGVPVTEFLDEFIKIANTDYPDAANRMSRTWQGVTSNLKDFLQTFIGIDLLKPVMDRFTNRVADMLDSLINNKSLQQGFRFLGQVLLRSLDMITPFVDNLVKAFGDLFTATDKVTTGIRYGADAMDQITSQSKFPEWARNIAVSILTVTKIIGQFLEKITGKITEFKGKAGGAFDSIATKAYTWGIGFIKSFSNGITGGLRLLTSVIKGVTQILTYFFKPHSPPLVAPEIDTWGAETMNEWIKGFTNADFSLFDETAGLVESWFRSLGEDVIAKDALVPMILNARNAIAQGIAGGGAGVAMSGLGNIDANVSGLFQNLFDTLFKMPAAENAVAQATQQVNIAQSALDDARARLDAFDESLYGIADAEAAVAAAGQKVKDVQSQINAVTDRYDAIISGLRAQLAEVTDTFEENNRLREIEEAIATGLLTAEEKERLENEKKRIALEKQIKETENQRDAEVAAMELRLAAAKAEEDAAQSKLDTLKAEVEAKKKLLEIDVERAQKELDAAKAVEDKAKSQIDLIENQAEAIKKQIEALIEQNGLLAEQKKILQEIADEQGPPDVQQPFSPVDVPPSDIESMMAEIDKLTAEASTKADEFWKSIDEIKNTWTSSGITTEWDNLTKSMGNLKDQVWAFAGGKEGESPLDLLNRKWGDLRKALGVPEGEDFLTWLSKKLDENIGKIATGAYYVGLAAQTLYNGVTLIVEVGRQIMDSFFIKSIATIGTDFLAAGKNIFVGSALMSDAFKKLDEDASLPIKNFSLTLGNFLDVMLAFNPGFLATWSIIKGISSGVDAVGKLYLAFADYFNKFVDSLKAFKDNADVSDKFKKFADNVSDAVTKIIGILTGPLANSVGGTNSVIFDLLREIIETGLIGAADAFNLAPRARGGRVANNRTYMVGEKGPEVFRPDVNGMIFPSMSAASVASPFGGNTSIDKSVTIEINPTYANTQSEASIFYDVQAALATVYRR